MSRLVFWCCFLELAFVGLFTADLLGWFKIVSQPIADLSDAQGTVRRLGANELTWDRAWKGTSFGANDTIATGSDSVALLNFKGGGNLKLGPDTMVVLKNEAKELKLSFVTGGENAELHIAKNAVSKIIVEPAQNQPRIAVHEDGISTNRVPAATKPATIPALQIEKRFVSSVEVSEKLIRNREIHLQTQNQILQVVSLPASPLLETPQESDTLTLKFSEPLKMIWKTEALGANKEGVVLVAPKQYELVLRRKQNDRDHFEEKKLLTTQQSITLKNIPAGNYEWTVRALSASGKPAEVPNPRKFTLVRIPDPPTRANIQSPKVLPVKIQ